MGRGYIRIQKSIIEQERFFNIIFDTFSNIKDISEDYDFINDCAKLEVEHDSIKEYTVYSFLLIESETGELTFKQIEKCQI